MALLTGGGLLLGCLKRWLLGWLGGGLEGWILNLKKKWENRYISLLRWQSHLESTVSHMIHTNRHLLVWGSQSWKQATRRLSTFHSASLSRHKGSAHWPGLQWMLAFSVQTAKEIARILGSPFNSKPTVLFSHQTLPKWMLKSDSFSQESGPGCHAV